MVRSWLLIMSLDKQLEAIKQLVSGEHPSFLQVTPNIYRVSRVFLTDLQACQEREQAQIATKLQCKLAKKSASRPVRSARGKNSKARSRADNLDNATKLSDVGPHKNRGAKLNRLDSHSSSSDLSRLRFDTTSTSIPLPGSKPSPTDLAEASTIHRPQLNHVHKKILDLEVHSPHCEQSECNQKPVGSTLIKNAEDDFLAEDSPQEFNCPICKWPFPTDYNADQRNRHINLCLDGQGAEDVQNYFLDSRMLQAISQEEEKSASRPPSRIDHLPISRTSGYQSHNLQTRITEYPLLQSQATNPILDNFKIPKKRRISTSRDCIPLKRHKKSGENPSEQIFLP